MGHMGRHAGKAISRNEQKRSHRKGILPQNRHSGFWQWGTRAGTQAQPFLQISKRAPTGKAHCHKIDIVDFGIGAHGQARRHSHFNK